MNRCLLLFFLCGLCSLPFAQAGEIGNWTDMQGDSARLEQYILELETDPEIDRDSLRVIFRSGYEQFLKEGYKEGQAMMLYKLGGLYSAESMLSASVEAYRESLALFRELGHDRMTAYSSASLGTAMGRRGEYDEAATLLMDALHIFERLEDQSGIANTYLKLGTVHTYVCR